MIEAKFEMIIVLKEADARNKKKTLRKVSEECASKREMCRKRRTESNGKIVFFKVRKDLW